jgi:hypothetical protein
MIAKGVDALQMLHSKLFSIPCHTFHLQSINISYNHPQASPYRRRLVKMFTLPSKKTILAALPFVASAGAVPCVQFDADWSLYAFGGSEDVKLGGSGSWGCKLLLYFM